MKLLGHSSIATTIRYIKMSFKDLEKHENPLDTLYGIEKKDKDEKKLLDEKVKNVETNVEKLLKKLSRIEEMLKYNLELT